MCPYRSDNEWQTLRDNAPDDFAKAVKFEQQLQKHAAQFDVKHKVPYLHSSLVPLSQVEFFDSTKQMDMFDNECQGMCGL